MTRAVDTVVIGGGVIGCAVAYYASKRGQRVVLIDAAKRGRATSASAGGLWPMGESLGMGCGVIFFKAMLERGELDGGTAGPSPLPASFFDFTLRSNALFPPLVEELREATEIDVEFDRSSLLFLMYDDGDVAFAESLKTSHTGDLPPLDWLTPQALAEVEPAITRELEGAVRLHGEDQINPYRLSDALRAAARAQGAVVVSHTEVTGIRTELDRVVAVETADAVFPCKAVVNAAGAWAGHIGRMVGLDLPVEPVRGQIICSETLPPLLHSCLSTSSGYLVQKRHGEIIIGSTTEETGFDVRVTPAAMRDLSAAAVRAVPALARATVKRVWAGVRPGTPDELPILGGSDGVEGYLNACGHFRTGVLTAPLTGQLLAELLVGDSPCLPIEPFLLSRFEQPAGATPPTRADATWMDDNPEQGSQDNQYE